jgi:hypothetical protein
MFCRKCGAQNADNAWKCTNCGETLYSPGQSGQAGAPGQPVKIKNYLVESILITLFCCLPFGIAAIINAAQVNGKAASGDIAGAQSAANNAKKFCTIGLIGGLIVTIAYIALIATGVIQQ